MEASALLNLNGFGGPGPGGGGVGAKGGAKDSGGPGPGAAKGEGMKATKVIKAAEGIKVGTDGQCSPRHQTHF